MQACWWEVHVALLAVIFLQVASRHPLLLTCSFRPLLKV